MNFKTKIKRNVFFMCASVLFVWGLFYLYTAQKLRVSNERGMQQASEQIINSLENSLLELENFAFSLRQNPIVKDFITEADALVYYEKSAAVDELVDTLTSTGTSVDSLILFSAHGPYGRFIGSLGNTAVSRIESVLTDIELPYYAALSLEGVPYIGYAAGIYEEEQYLGMVALLIEEEQLLSLLTQYGSDSLEVSLVSGGKVITASVEGLSGLAVAELMDRSALFLNRSIGFAPFEIYVTVRRGYLSSIYTEFAVTAFVTAAIFMGLLTAFLTIANRSFFKPLLSVMHDVESLGVSDGFTELSITGEEAFDSLVNQINLMLKRLDEKNSALFHANIQLQTAELQRQRSLVISLKKQINAHFTVNVLNIIKVLTEQGDMEKAADLSVGLSQLIRYANAGDEFINAMEEYDVLQKYVSIMAARYPGRFHTVFEWDDQLMDIQMPRMLVQPLIENAIVHGFSSGSGEIHISGRVNEDKIMVIVSDNGCGMAPEQVEKLMVRMQNVQAFEWEVEGITNIALVNIHNRIFSYFGAGYGVDIKCGAGCGTAVCISLPLLYQS